MPVAQSKTAVCPKCKCQFVQNRRWQRFCSPDCRDDWHLGRLQIVRPLSEYPVEDERLAQAVRDTIKRLEQSK